MPGNILSSTELVTIEISFSWKGLLSWDEFWVGASILASRRDGRENGSFLMFSELGFMSCFHENVATSKIQTSFKAR